MKQFFLVALVSLAACSPVPAQHDVQKPYDSAVDLLNFKVADFSLGKKFEGFKAGGHYSDKRLPTFEKLKAFLLSSGDKGKNLKLAEEIEGLKSRSDLTIKPGDTVQFFSVGVFTDRQNLGALFEFKENHKNQADFASWRIKLEKELAALLESPPDADTPGNVRGRSKVSDSMVYTGLLSLLQQDSAHIVILEHRVGSLEDSQGWMLGIGGIALLLVLALGIVRIRRRSGPRESRESSEREIRTFRAQFSDAFQDLKREQETKFQLNNDKISRLERRLDAMQQAVVLPAAVASTVAASAAPTAAIPSREHTPANTPISPSANTTIPPLEPGGVIGTPVPVTSPVVPAQAGEVFYLSTPNKDGNFNKGSASREFVEGASIYRFTKIDSDSAYFEVDERKDAIRLALQFIDKNIDPVCDTQNAYTSKNSRIRNIEKGVALLKSDKWVVQKKATIRYEN